MKIVNVSGRRFGRLVPLRATGEVRSGSKVWLCQCDCGQLCELPLRYFRRKKKWGGRVRSCGRAKAHNPARRLPHREEVIRRIREMRARGCSLAEIAKELKTSKQNISQWLQRYGA